MTKTFHLPISGNLGIVAQEVNSTTEPQVEVSLNSNYIFVCDDSGSMYSEIRQLRESVKELIRDLKPGDTLTIARFSSSGGDYDYFVRAFPINENQNYKGVDSLIDKYLTASNLTCYTEVLNEAKNVIDDITKISTSNNFSLCFLSDGYPNDRSGTNEIYAAIDSIKGLVNQSFIIGYGRYYNKQLLGEMASRMGSSLVHNDSAKDFDITFKSFIAQKPAGKNMLVKIIEPSELMFYITQKGEVVRVKADTNGNVTYPMSKMSNTIYSIIDAPVLATANADDFAHVYFAASLVLSQSLRTYDAIKTLSTVGDKFLVDKLSKAFTTSQYGVVENLISSAVSDKNSRFIQGKHQFCLPDENAFCFLDLLDVLNEDDSLMFYPNDTRFDYKRISRKSEFIDNARDFKENKNDGYKVSNITMNATRPNVSMLIIKEGKVQLHDPKSDGYRKREAMNVRNRRMGLETVPNQFETFVFRNYAIVADGDYNVNILPLSLSEDTYNKLKAVGVIPSTERYGKSKIFGLNVSNLPIVSRKYAKDGFTAQQFAETFQAIQTLKVNQTVTKFFINSLKPLDSRAGEDEFKTKYGVEGYELLKESGITSKGGYNPGSSATEAKDFYLAKEFKISVSGFSKISVPDYLTKAQKIREYNLTGGKGKEPKFTACENVIDKFYKECYAIHSPTVSETLMYLNHRLEAIKADLKLAERKLQNDKIAMVLTNSDFSDATERGPVSVAVNEYNVTLDMKETSIYF